MRKRAFITFALVYVGLVAWEYAEAARLKVVQTEVLSTVSITSGDPKTSSTINVADVDDVSLRCEFDGLDLTETVNVTTEATIDGVVWSPLALGGSHSFTCNVTPGSADSAEKPIFFPPGVRNLRFIANLTPATTSANVTLTVSTRKEEDR